MRKIFEIEIGRADDGSYLANVVSTGESKGTSVEGPALKFVLAQALKLVRKRESHNLRFPAPEPPRILALNGAHGDTGPQLIIPARN